MRRREFIGLLGGAAAIPFVAHAQQSERMRSIGVLLPASPDDPVFQARLAAFHQELALLGWIIGRNVRIDTRWATTNPAEIRRNATELVALAPDVILSTGDSTVPPLLQATRTVPIVFPVANDPIGAGHSRPARSRASVGGGLVCCWELPRMIWKLNPASRHFAKGFGTLVGWRVATSTSTIVLPLAMRTA